MFLTENTLVLDTVYDVTEYRKFYDNDNNIYVFLIKVTTVGDSNTYTIYINEGPIFDRLFSGITTPFSIKKTSIAIDDTTNINVIIIVGDHDWKTLV